jgi:flagellar motor switch/type III secretory pathway protein FliN
MEKEKDTAVKILSQLEGTLLPLAAVLLEDEITVAQLLQLNPGNVLRFNKPLDSPVTLTVNNKKIAQGTVVQIGDRYAIELISFIGPQKEI